MTRLALTVHRTDGRTEDTVVDVERIANLGMAARDSPDDETLERWFDGMSAAGVPTPSRLPSIVPKPNHLITTANRIQVNSSNTAGEVEFVLIPASNRTYVAVGNDHKDRDLDGSMMHKANSTCPSVMSSDVWLLEDIVDHWDALELRSWVAVDGSLTEHQRASVTAFMTPEELIERVAERITAPITGTAIWSGTVGVGDEAVDPFPAVRTGERYLLQLDDPVLDRRLFSQYEVRLANWIRDIDLDGD